MSRFSDEELAGDLLYEGEFARPYVNDLIKELQTYRAVMPKVREALEHAATNYYFNPVSNQKEPSVTQYSAKKALALLDQLERGEE